MSPWFEHLSWAYSATHSFCSFKVWLHPLKCSWLRNSVRMTKVEAVGGSTKTLLTQLKVIALVSDVMFTVPQDYNSRSGATPLSLHHSSQKVNPSVKSKIKKDKRKVKDVITGTRTQVSPPPSQKRYQQCEFPPRSKELRVNAAQVLSHPSLIIRLLAATMFSIQ